MARGLRKRVATLDDAASRCHASRVAAHGHVFGGQFSRRFPRHSGWTAKDGQDAAVLPLIENHEARSFKGNFVYFSHIRAHLIRTSCIACGVTV